VNCVLSRLALDAAHAAPHAERGSVRALHVVLLIHSQKWGTSDFYQRAFIVAERGKALAKYQP
jgi:hypothetical protein